MNTFGHNLRFTSFGESHGRAVGGVLDGFPSGVSIDFDLIQREVDRRRPGQNALSSQRHEEDKVEFLSGFFEGKTLGTPIAFLVYNKDQRSQDYTALEHVYRPSHADYTYEMKYGLRDFRGGGRASARETVSRVVAGALSRQYLAQKGIDLMAGVSQVGVSGLGRGQGPEALPSDDDYRFLLRRMQAINQSDVLKAEVHPMGSEVNDFLLGSEDQKEAMQQQIKAAKEEMDSVGGVVSLAITGLTPGLGRPLYDKLSARLAQAMLSINAVKGFELGDGFAMAQHRGSEMNDRFVMHQAKVVTSSNHNGGVLGGLSTGMPLLMRVAFKPTPSIGQEQQTINDKGEAVTLSIQGRHDPCVALRGVPVVEAMAALTLLDFWLDFSSTHL